MQTTLQHPAGNSENSAFCESFTIVVYEKHILKHTKMINTFDTKIILHNYLLYWGEANGVGTFPVYLTMVSIFTNFPAGSGSYLGVLLEICLYQSQLENFQYNSVPPLLNMIVQYYFCVKCIGHLCMLQNMFICVLIDHYCKTELTDMLKSTPNLLNFLQGVEAISTALVVKHRSHSIPKWSGCCPKVLSPAKYNRSDSFKCLVISIGSGTEYDQGKNGNH